MLNDAENDLMLGDEEEEEDVIGDEDDGRTPLDRTIDKIGMGACFACASPAKIAETGSFTGPYQWVLLSLCGFGIPSTLFSVISLLTKRLHGQAGWPTMWVTTPRNAHWGPRFHGLTPPNGQANRHCFQMWLQGVAIILPRVQRHYDSEYGLSLQPFAAETNCVENSC